MALLIHTVASSLCVSQPAKAVLQHPALLFQHYVDHSQLPPQTGLKP